MELVSANTKNYLFITMNQYNDKDGLVRARVTMRRDQPFWEGGNSFIACVKLQDKLCTVSGGVVLQDFARHVLPRSSRSYH